MVGQLLIGLVFAACGDSPPSPSESLNGNWSGTWQFRTAGVMVTENATAMLTQTGSTVSGTWMAQSGPAGELTFAVAESFTGTLTISQTLLTGQVCSGSTTVTGSASSSRLEFAAAPIAPAGLCQWATEMQFSLQR